MMLILITRKKTTAAKRMYNAKKPVIHIPKLRVAQYLLLFYISYYLKMSLICSKFLMQKRTVLGQKTEMLKI